MKIKNFVKEYYLTHLDLGNDPDALKGFLHPDVELYWNSSSGFNKMNFNEIAEITEKFAKSFISVHAEISHLLMEKDTVTVRYTYFVKTIENPDEVLPIAHFISIWEIKDDLLYRGYQISQPADDSPENLDSFSINA